MALPDHVFVDMEVGEDDDTLPEVLYSQNFLYTLTFTAETKSAGSGGGTGGGGSGGSGGSSTPIIVSATNIQVEPPFAGVKCEFLPPNKLRISGSYLLAFNDYYEFVRKTKEIVRLPPDTKDIDIALIQYKMPNPTRRKFEYPVKVTWPSGSSWEGTPIETKVNIYQWSRWTIDVAEQNIHKLKFKSI